MFWFLPADIYAPGTGIVTRDPWELQGLTGYLERDRMSEIADTQGLVCGYSVDTSGKMTNIDMFRVDEVLAADDALVWLHFDQADPRARAWINACDKIPASAKAMLLGTDSHMRIEAAGAGL